jgi:ribosomal protein S18 acetylase RimI-like enzyme
MSGVGADELARMQEVARRVWPLGRRWAPGEIAWMVVTDLGDEEVCFVGDGFCWKQGGVAAVVTTSVDDAMAAIESAGECPVQADDRDRTLAKALTFAGLHELPGTPFELDMRCATGDVPDPDVGGGLVVRSARDGDDLVAVHRASWRPADLPFAADHAPTLDPDATSSFTTEMLAAVQRRHEYDANLHVVVEAPGRGLVASCIAWFDATTGTAAIEPLGVCPEFRNLGLAGAMCRYAAARVGDRGGAELVIHPRGDVAYPAPRGAYRRAGFVTAGRTRLYARS